MRKLLLFQVATLGFFLSLSPHAQATQLAAVEVSCPGPAGVTTVVNRLVTQNALGGWDADGASYSTEGQYRAYALASCPDSGLTLLGQDLSRGLTAEQWMAVGPVVEALAREGLQPAALPVWERYEVAARFYESMGRDPWFIAKLRLRATWTLRDTAVGVYPGLQGPLHARLLLEAGEAELSKDLTPRARTVLLFNLARIAHRGGYARERDALLDQLTSLSESLTSGETEVLSAFEQVKILEPTLLERTATSLEAALKHRGVSQEDKLQALYLLSELQRRLGRTEQALQGFQAVAGTKGAPEHLRSLASYFVAELSGEKPWREASLSDLSQPPL